MKMTFLLSALLLACMGLGSPAHALVEARLTYTALASGADLTKVYPAGTLEVPSIVPNVGLGGDLLIFVPMTGVGFGLRQENLGFKASKDALNYESTAARTSAVFAYRLINTVLHIGPIFTYGLSHSGKMKVDDGTNKYEWEPGSSSSYSAGIEAGVGLAAFVLGAEAGYQNMKWNKLKDKEGDAATPDLDMSGSYMKIFLGISI
ncbi:MAG: hypothetical protein KF802_05970 [Bdellovibrionaceae bacterium]|nr:hypothetical protein [Pseudobdellovibrionaceae bacterium]MBX3032466.1 hypothetical protein [Pseudobdellovibrionaceae bacterium]